MKIEQKETYSTLNIEQKISLYYSDYAKTNGGKGTEEPVTIWYDAAPLPIPEAVRISKWLTARHNRPIVVIPTGKEVTTERFLVDSYGRFKCSISAEFETTRAQFELFKTTYYWLVEENDSGKERSRRKVYEVHFLSEPQPKRCNYDPFNSFRFERYYYNAVSETDEKFILLSETKLDVGQEYNITGSVFSTSRFDISGAKIGKRQLVCLSSITDDAETKFDLETLEKCRGKNMGWFTQSVTYPFDNSLVEFSELITLNALHLQTGFPFNLVLIGGADRSKTAFLVKMSSITKSLIYETGASTVKGLLPSFSRDNMDAGILASSGCKHKALINEFFEIIAKVPKSARGSYLTSLKSTLEGRLTPFVSGLGKMVVRQRGDLLAATNFPEKQGGYRFKSVYELYEDFDPAFLDRILFYTVPRDQEKLVVDNKDRVKAMLMDTGKTDEVEAISALDYGLFLSPAEIRQLMALGKRVKVVLKDVEHKKKMSKQFIEQLPAERFTRHSEFLLNIASAYAYIRVLSDGSLMKQLPCQQPVVEILPEDVDRASSFLWVILGSYQNLEDSLSERAVKVRMLTSKEKEIFGLLKEHYGKNENVHLKKLLAKDVMQYSGNDSPSIMAVVEKELAITDGVSIMYMPELSVEASAEWKKLKEGNQTDKRFGMFLYKIGLANRHTDEYGNYWFENLWVRKEGLGVVI